MDKDAGSVSGQQDVKAADGLKDSEGISEKTPEDVLKLLFAEGE